MIVDRMNLILSQNLDVALPVALRTFWLPSVAAPAAPVASLAAARMRRLSPQR
jgi:hypothetical protein